MSSWNDVACDPTRSVKLGGRVLRSDKAMASLRQRKLPAQLSEVWSVVWSNLDNGEQLALQAAYTEIGGVSTWTPPGDASPRYFLAKGFKITKLSGSLFSASAELKWIPDFFIP